MTKSTSVTEHINTMTTLFSQLTSLRYKVKPNEYAELLLQNQLDLCNQPIINLINNVLTNYLVFDEVAVIVLEEESRHKNKEEKLANLQQAEAVVMTRERSIEIGSNGRQRHGRSKSRSKKNIKCYKCDKKGHLEKDCWNLKVSSPQENIAITSDDGNAQCSKVKITNIQKKKIF